MIDAAQVRLVAGREIRESVRGKPVWIATAITLIGVALAIVLPQLLAGGPTTYRVAVTGNPAAAVTATIRQAARAAGARAEIVRVPDRATAVAALRGKASGVKGVDIAVDTAGPGSGGTPADEDGGPPSNEGVAAGGVAGGGVIVDRAFAAGSTDGKALTAQAIARGIAQARAIAASGLSPQQARAVVDPQPLAIEHLRAAPASSAHRGLALGTAIVFFILVLGFGTGVLTSVVHEKSTRVVEVILSSMRPVNLLAGKVFGASCIVLAQGALLVATALISAHAVGSDVLTAGGSGPGAIVAAGVWIVLGFVLYAWLFAALGSLASRVEDAQSIAFPLQIPLFVGYFASFSALGSGTANPVITVLAYVPFTAPMDMPVLAATGGAAWWQVAVSMAITVATTVVIARLASLVFGRSILRIGQRVRLRSVLGAHSRESPRSMVSSSPR